MKKSLRLFIIVALTISVGLAMFVAPFASSSPDGLERVAKNHGFLEKGEHSVWAHSPIADYLFPGIKNEAVATGLAGFVGTLVVFIVAYGIVLLLKRVSGGAKRVGEETRFKD